MASPHALDDGAERAPVVAQYLVTKITFWGSYRRLLTVSATHVALYNPEDFTCTNQWFLSVIADIEIASDPDQFLLVFEKLRFRTSKLRFHCHARSHLLSVLHKLRRQSSFEPLRMDSAYGLHSGRPQHYQCSEHFADDSYDYFLLKVGLSGVTVLDEHGRKVARFPFIGIQRIATSTAHPDGIVISTLFQERLFLCNPRHECIDHMCAAARSLGVAIPIEESPLNMQLLRLRNSQALDNPAVVCFEVVKSIDDGKIEQLIQLIFQGTAMVEVHRKMRTIITRPYSALLAVVLSEWDADTVILQFVQNENVVVRVESRDQFVAILLLVCREAGSNQVELASSTIKKHRLFHPHITENVRETAGASMESFFLRRVLGILARDAPEVLSHSPLKQIELTNPQRGRAKGRRSEKPPAKRGQGAPRRRGLHSNAVLIETRMSVDTGISLNDHVSLAIALEELNTNVSLGGFSDSCNRQLLNRTIEALIEYLSSQVASLRSYLDAPVRDIITTLQSLTRMAESRHALFAEDQVPVLFEALHEIVVRRHFLSKYWVLKLLQRYFEPRKGDQARLHRSKALQAFVDNRELLYAILDVIPATSSFATNSSGRWMRPGSETQLRGGGRDDDSDAHMRQDLSQTLLFTKEERLEKDMNILTYEALFTLHHVLVFLQAKEKQESESVVSALAKSKILEEQRTGKVKDWASTIDFVDSEYDVDVHQENYKMAATAKRAIGERLLGKYKFLMDSVVDVRLARSCQTVVALINFLVFYFNQDGASAPNSKSSVKATRAPPPCGFVLYEDERADPSGTMLYQVGFYEEYRRKRNESVPLRRSVLGDVETEVSAEEAEERAVERKLNELFAFLECYQADVATLDDRSRLFPDQNTILMPLSGFSQISSTSSSVISFFNVSGTLPRQPEDDEDFLTLDHLVFNEEEEDAYHRAQDNRRVTILDPIMEAQTKPRMPLPEDPQRRAEGQVKSIRELKQVMDWPDSSTSSDDLSIVDSQSSSGGSLVPRFMMGSNFRRLETPRGGVAGVSALKQQHPQPVQVQHQTERQRHRREARSNPSLGAPVKVEKLLQRPHRTRPASTAMDQRISAHTCDACIACNDVCDGKNCFFCAEKEYQLQIAFEASSSLPPLETSSTLSSSLNAARKYSSCEVRRHLTARSCWIVIFGLVYDVTDLLSSHPGGMDVLIKAATIGKDMGELFVKKHPPRARRVLENYYIGEFYHCENRTVLA